jgi:serine/threonine protein kinase
VCRVYEFGTHEGTMFLTMQLLSGRTLADLIHDRGRLPIDEALPLARASAS